MAMSSVLIAAGGAATSTVGAYYSALGEKSSLSLQADIDAINARIARGAARDAMARGEREHGAYKLKQAGAKSAARTALADNGFELGSGTPAQILTGMDVLGEVDADTIKANAVREAWGHRLEEVNLKGRSAVNRASAKSINPTLNAAATLLTTGGQVASQYYGLKESGAFDKKTADPARITVKKIRF